MLGRHGPPCPRMGHRPAQAGRRATIRPREVSAGLAARASRSTGLPGATGQTIGTIGNDAAEGAVYRVGKRGISDD